jgi:hypothetical protein
MSKLHDKQYQLWVWYNVQNADNPQNGYSLVLETDNPDELYRAVIKLNKDDEYMTTEKVDLRVSAV